SRVSSYSIYFTTEWPLTGSLLFPYTTLFRSIAAIIKLVVFGGPLLRSGPIADNGLCHDKSAGGDSRAKRSVGARCIGSWCADDSDRKSTRLNSSHEWISYAVFCL